MNDLSCTLDTIVAQEERRRRPAPSTEDNVDEIMGDAIRVTRIRINQAFAKHGKVQARLRA